MHLLQRLSSALNIGLLIYKEQSNTHKKEALCE